MDRKHLVAPCAMVHPQQVSGQLRDAALYRPYQTLAAELQAAAAAGERGTGTGHIKRGARSSEGKILGTDGYCLLVG